MTTLSTIKYDSKIQVKVPYSIKDIFKKTFKTAKWNNYMKTWDINDNARNEAKLVKFNEEIKDLLEELDNLEEVELKDKELENLRNEIQSLRNEIEEKKEEKKNLAKINSEIDSAKEEIESLKVELAKAQAEKKEEEKKVEAFVDSLIDTEKLEDISSTISDYARKRPFLAVHKEELRKELSYAHEAVKILAEAGFKSRNVSRLSNTVLSRLDRDNFNFSSEDFYDIEKID
jgi:DNA repair exonuclease SbcCD ATPase subunit